MKLWGTVKNTAEKTKLRGDILMTQRAILDRKKKFGVEFYDILTNVKQNLLGVTAGTLSVFKKGGTDDELRSEFERTRDDIRGKEARKQEFQSKLDILEVKGDRNVMPDTTIGQKMSKAGKIVSNAGTGTKIRGQMALVDREISSRKGEFGLSVYSMAKSTEDKAKKGLIKGAISKAMTGLSDHEKAIQKIVDTARKNVEALESEVESLQRRIAIIDSEM